MNIFCILCIILIIIPFYKAVFPIKFFSERIYYKRVFPESKIKDLKDIGISTASQSSLLPSSEYKHQVFASNQRP